MVGLARRLEARPCPPVPPAPSTPVGPGVLRVFPVVRCVALNPSYGCQPAIPHVIPPWLVQTFTMHRWNCNVFGVSRKMTVINYVRNVGGGGVVAAHGHRVWVLQARWPGGFETLVAFARWCLCGCETAIAFAGEKWVFLACFSVAKVPLVSMVAVQGRAVVMVVSCLPTSVVAEVSLVSPSSPQCVLCAKKFALRGLVVGVSAKKFALRGHNGPKLVFSGVLGELFRGWGVGGGVLGELFRACQPATACRPHGQALRGLRHPPRR